MTVKTPVTFDQALHIAIDAMERYRDSLKAFYPEYTVVRDIMGRIRIVFRGERHRNEEVSNTVDSLARELSEYLGSYGWPPLDSILFSDELMEGDALFRPDNMDRRTFLSESGREHWLLDRQLTGLDWGRMPLARKSKPRRVTFFSIKGGVGRSTALCVWAWWLARSGRNVMVFDLDLESPGISGTLLPLADLPDFGIVDWFVEDGVGQAEMIENAMVAPSPLSADLSGDILVVPAYGGRGGDYLGKLARCYMDRTSSGVMPWGERLQHMVEQIETDRNPDVVFLDSRAGIHDIAAVLVTRMDADSYLFSVDSEQTWKAYSFLFQHWKQSPRQVIHFRERLQIVAGLIPETGREGYMRHFKERSWDLFRDNIYDEATNGDLDAFSFDIESREAPHYPLQIFWNRALQEFNPLASGFDRQIIEAAYGGFMKEAHRRIFPEDELTWK